MYCAENAPINESNIFLLSETKIVLTLQKREGIFQLCISARTSTVAFQVVDRSKDREEGRKLVHISQMPSPICEEEWLTGQKEEGWLVNDRKICNA